MTLYEPDFKVLRLSCEILSQEKMFNPIFLDTDNPNVKYQISYHKIVTIFTLRIKIGWDILFHCRKLSKGNIDCFSWVDKTWRGIPDNIQDYDDLELSLMWSLRNYSDIKLFGKDSSKIISEMDRLI